MELTIDRKWKKDGYTIGRLYADGKYLFNTLEDKDRGLTNDMTENEIRAKKVYGQTAVPTGSYAVILSRSNRFASRTWGAKYNGETPEITGVKGFSGIRIHPGNKPSDTLGCILPGLNTRTGMVTQSTKCYYELMDEYILPALKRRENITLIIK